MFDRSLLPRALTTAGLLMGTLMPAAAQTPAPVAQVERLDQVSFGLDGAAGAEQGGFFQALADGTYQSYGLDVTIMPGTPGQDIRRALQRGQVDFALAADTLRVLEEAQGDMPPVAVAAIFQKTPLALLTHPDEGVNRLDELQTATLFVPATVRPACARWLTSEYGLGGAQVKPLASDMQAFIADKTSAMLGAVTSAPLALEQLGKFEPRVTLLADAGCSAYAGLIATRASLIDRKPDLVQRFVDASLIGWYNYLYRDHRPGNELIKAANGAMSDARLDDARARIRAFGLVDSAGALQDGIGAMSDVRMADFFSRMVRAGVVRRDLDYRKAYTLRFVNKAVGRDLRPDP